MSKKLNVVFVSGPRHAGKSTLIRTIAPRLCSEPPHYLRLVPVNGEAPRLTLLGDLKTAGLASWKRVNYDEQHIFEFLPECMIEIAGMRVSRTVLIEADADPNLRYAYPYDHRVFVMPTPQNIHEIFRSPTEAATALKEVMDDTAAFATEIFGLFDPRADEDEGVSFRRVRDHRRNRVEECLEIRLAQMRRFMNSPLGAEIASRIQFQPPYHSLMESDLIVVNKGVGGSSEIVQRCIKQIQLLIARLGEGRMNRPVMYHCNPMDFADPLQFEMIQRLKPMLDA